MDDLAGPHGIGNDTGFRLLDPNAWKMKYNVFAINTGLLIFFLPAPYRKVKRLT